MQFKVIFFFFLFVNIWMLGGTNFIEDFISKKSSSTQGLEDAYAQLGKALSSAEEKYQTKKAILENKRKQERSSSPEENDRRLQETALLEHELEKLNQPEKIKNEMSDILKKISLQQKQENLAFLLLDSNFFSQMCSVGFNLDKEQFIKDIDFFGAGEFVDLLEKNLVEFPVSEPLSLVSLIPLIPNNLERDCFDIDPYKNYFDNMSVEKEVEERFCYFSGYYLGTLAINSKFADFIPPFIGSILKEKEGEKKLKILLLFFLKAQINFLTNGDTYAYWATINKSSPVTKATVKNLMKSVFFSENFLSSPAAQVFRALYRITPGVFKEPYYSGQLKSLSVLLCAVGSKSSGIITQAEVANCFYDSLFKGSGIVSSSNKYYYALLGGIIALLFAGKKWQWYSKFQQFLEKYRKK